VASNPKQLFATGRSAFFIGVMTIAAGKQKTALPKELRLMPKSTWA
jgi:organic hydroperoxide reductase OsmC/OhrA